MTAAGIKTKAYALAVLTILIVAAVLRVRYTDMRGSLSGDEVWEAMVAVQAESFADACTMIANDGQSPGHYLLSRAVAQLWGRDALVARWHVLVAGVLTVLLLMELARRWFGAGCALGCGVFAATSPFLIYYSVELRGYSLLGLLTLLHVGVSFRHRERRTTGWTIAWGLSAAAVVYVHYFGLFVVLVTGVLALFDRPFRRSLVQAILAGAVFLVAFAPWLPHLARALRSGEQIWASAAPPFEIVYSPVTLIVSVGAASLVVGGLLLGFVFAANRVGPPGPRNRFLSLVVIVVASTLISWLVQQQEQRGFAQRYLIGQALLLLPAALAPWGALRGLAQMPFWKGLNTGRIYRVGPALPCLVGAALFGSALYLQLQDPDDWITRPLSPHHEARALIETQWREGDLVVVNSYVQGTTFAFECEGRVPVRIGPHPTRAAEAEFPILLQDIEERLQRGDRVWYYTFNHFEMFPRPVDGPLYSVEPPAGLNDHDLECRRIHMATMELLERLGDEETVLDTGWSYINNFRLSLYRAKRR